MACAANPVFALGSQRSVGGSSVVGNNDTGTSSRQPSIGGSNNWQDHAAALQGMAREQFAGMVGTNFKVIMPDDAQPVWITLQAVEDFPEIAPVNPASFAVPIKRSSVAPVAPSSSGFFLKFGGSTPVAQGTYLLEHGSLGQFALFIVPAGNGEQVYTAVVNRLNAPTIIAVPFAAGTNAGSATTATAPAGVVIAPAPASARTGNQSPDLSGSRAVQRSVRRD